MNSGWVSVQSELSRGSGHLQAILVRIINVTEKMHYCGKWKSI